VFGFFLSDCAALDSFCFFRHFAAAYFQPRAFPTLLPGHIKGVCCKSTPAFASPFPSKDIAAALDALLTDVQGLRSLSQHPGPSRCAGPHDLAAVQSSACGPAGKPTLLRFSTRA
jgi:hypothetical protein